MSSLLSVADLEVSYRSKGVSRPALRGVSLDVQPGDYVAVVGESGSGKSTLAHAIIGQLPDAATVTAGTVNVAGVDVTADPKAARRLGGTVVGFVPQEPGVSLHPNIRVVDQVAEVVRIKSRIGRKAARALACDALAEAGFPDPRVNGSRFPHELSGGTRQRVLIAIAIVGNPNLLVADEPTSALDVTVQRAVLDQLDRIRDKHQMAIVLITHDLALAAERSDRVAVMYNGEIVEQNSSAAVFVDPQAAYTRALLASSPTLQNKRLVPATASNTESDTSAIRVQGLTKHFGRGKNKHVALSDVSFDVKHGKTLALVGESGSGKSTIARSVVRLVRPTSGSVEVLGHNMTALSGADLRAMRRRIQIVYQNPYASLDPRFTVSELIEEPLRALRIGSAASRHQRSESLVNDVALPGDVLDRRPSELSGGQRQRVAIARALALDPEVVVLDEPVSALDVSVQTQILQLLVDLQASRDLSYLFITHDLAVVRQIADDVVVLRQGVVVEQGSADTVLDSPSDPYTVKLVDSVPRARLRQL